jgi:hypothetical protein
MQVATTLPAVLRGKLTPATPMPPGGKSMKDMDIPTMSWYLDPLPQGAPSEIEILIETEADETPSRSSNDWRTRFELRHQKLVELRPDAVGWIATVETHGIADIFQTAPLAPLIYEWLKMDLTAIKWQ